MIIATGIITYDPSKKDRAIELIGELVPATQAEDGNITYDYWEHLSTPGTMRVYEEWRDQAAIDAHMASPGMAAFLGSIGDLGVTGAEIYTHEVSESSRLM